MHAWKLLPLLTLTSLATADGSLFARRGPLEVSLRAPFQEIFQKGADDEKFSAAGVLSYRDPATGKEVVLPDVDVSVRGHTSRRGTECPFPKLRIKFRDKESRQESLFAGLRGVRIGTHCGD